MFIIVYRIQGRMKENSTLLNKSHNVDFTLISRHEPIMLSIKT